MKKVEEKGRKKKIKNTECNRDTERRKEGTLKTLFSRLREKGELPCMRC